MVFPERWSTVRFSLSLALGGQVWFSTDLTIVMKRLEHVSSSHLCENGFTPRRQSQSTPPTFSTSSVKQLFILLKVFEHAAILVTTFVGMKLILHRPRAKARFTFAGERQHCAFAALSAFRGFGGTAVWAGGPVGPAADHTVCSTGQITGHLWGGRVTFTGSSRHHLPWKKTFGDSVNQDQTSRSLELELLLQLVSVAYQISLCTF